MTKAAPLFRQGVMLALWVAAALALAAGVWWLRGQILHTRGALVEAAARQQQQLETERQQASLESQLGRRVDDIARISAMVPTPEDLDGVLSALEREAQQAGVVVAATARNAANEADGGIVESGEPFRLAPFAVTATGDPAALVRFLHAVEQAPYLTGVADFSLQTAPAGRPVPAGLAPPASGPPGFGALLPQPAGADLSFTLLVAVRKE